MWLEMEKKINLYTYHMFKNRNICGSFRKFQDRWK